MAMKRGPLFNELLVQTDDLEVLDREHPMFDDRCLYYNRSMKHKPLAIVRPKSPNAVSKVVSFCTAHGITIAVRSGGHDFFGRSIVHDGVVIDMRRIDSVDIAPDRKSANVGGGVIAGDLQQTLDKHRLFTPTGQATTVGYVSWACGGGYGFYVGSYGFGVDQILGAIVVLADGRIVDTDQEPELLWALRGAGAGTFGVVVGLRVKVYTTPKIYAGFLAFPIHEAPVVLERFQQLNDLNGIPDEFSGDAIVARPGMLQLPSSGGASYIFYWCWTDTQGDLSEAKEYLNKMKNLGTLLVDTVKESKPKSYTLWISRNITDKFLATPANFAGGDSSSPTFFRSCSVSDLGANVGKALAAEQPRWPLCAVVVHNNHGRGVHHSILDGIGSAFSNRYPHVILGLHGGTRIDLQECDSALDESASWVGRLETAISRLNCNISNGFPAFCPPDQVDPTEFFTPESAKRLYRLKERLDPDNVFASSFPRLMGKPVGKTRDV